MGFIDAVLELIVLSGQEQRDLIVSGTRVAKRRRISHGLSDLEFMAAHVVFPKNGTPNARNLCALRALDDGFRQEPQPAVSIGARAGRRHYRDQGLTLQARARPNCVGGIAKYFSSRKSLSGRCTEFRC